MIQLILHLWGDYILQSDWMSQNKTKRWWPAICHAALYSLGFLLIGSPLAVLVIFATHAVIDRYRLSRFVCWAKNQILSPAMVDLLFGYRMHGTHAELVVQDEAAPQFDSWQACQKTGFPEDRPDWLTVWLLIITDNALHLTINFLALAFL